MKSGSLLDWSVALGCGPDDLPDVTRRVVQGAHLIEEAAVGLRSVIHEVPDRAIDEAVMRLERSACDVTALIEDLHQEVLREFGR